MEQTKYSQDTGERPSSAWSPYPIDAKAAVRKTCDEWLTRSRLDSRVLVADESIPAGAAVVVNGATGRISTSGARTD